MQEKDFITQIWGKDSDCWLNIYNIYVNIRTVLIFMFGILFATYDVRNIEEKQYVGTLSFLTANEYLAWFILFFITIIVMCVSAIVSKTIISFLSDIKKIRDKK